MKLYTAEEMRRADRVTADAGVGMALLMETAGQRVAAAAQRHWPSAERVLVLCGAGNNGGDGYVAARHLHLAGKRVTVLEHARSEDDLRTEEASGARAAWLAIGKTGPFEELQMALTSCDLTVDALFGSGLTRALEEPFKTVVEALNAAEVPVLSVDIPSGLNAEDAEPLGPHIRAARTVQLAGAKRSSAFHPARAAFGAWEIADIGLLPETLRSQVQLLTDEAVRPWLPQRGATAHKYTVGTVSVIAGSAAYLGAAELAARAAYRAGAGLVTLLAEARLPSSWPEIIFRQLEWTRGSMTELTESKHAASRVIGPGLGAAASELLPALIAASDAPTVLDAGALTGTPAWKAAVRAHGRCVLTPHAGEAARLLQGSSSEEVNRRPLEAGLELATTFGAVVVLKGASTVIAQPSGELAVSARGHSGMATGGAGDVLAGILGAWLAADHDTLVERTAAAVYAHGAAGEAAAKRYGYGLLASDILEALPGVYMKLLRSS